MSATALFAIEFPSPRFGQTPCTILFDQIVLVDMDSVNFSHRLWIIDRGEQLAAPALVARLQISPSILPKQLDVFIVLRIWKAVCKVVWN